MTSEIKRALDAAGLGKVFSASVEPACRSVVTLTHDAVRASTNHALEDLHDAAEALRDAGFDAFALGWTVIVREGRKPALVDDYEAHDGQYAGAYDIEIGDLC